MTRLRAALLSFACLLAVGAVVGAADRPNFTGTWELDQSQSHSIPPTMKQTMTVVHAGDSVKVETKLTTPQGERVQTDAYTLDGKESEFTPPAPQGPNAPPPGAPAAKGKRTARWLPNDAGFVVEEEITQPAPQGGGTETIHVARKWRRWPDGTISVEIMTQSPRGEFNSKRVFVKK
ncbi:MAG TPA: hypothetical protein VGV38_01840 [Pyrinomonadaceae bacterium]|nr:hypothetical protein [Pyrinomonadaceae bacterium]